MHEQDRARPARPLRNRAALCRCVVAYGMRVDPLRRAALYTDIAPGRKPPRQNETAGKAPAADFILGAKFSSGGAPPSPHPCAGARRSAAGPAAVARRSWRRRGWPPRRCGIRGRRRAAPAAAAANSLANGPIAAVRPSTRRSPAPHCRLCPKAITRPVMRMADLIDARPDRRFDVVAAFHVGKALPAAPGLHHWKIPVSPAKRAIR